jgi:hypothetical protein
MKKEDRLKLQLKEKGLDFCIKSDGTKETAYKILNYFKGKNVENNYYHFSGTEGGNKGSYCLAKHVKDDIYVFSMYKEIPDGYNLIELPEHD